MRTAKLASVLITATLALISPAESATIFPGPNAFGYSGTVIPFNTRDMTGAVDLVAGDDFSVGGVALPFSFDFYGTSYTSIWVSTNGLIGFTPADEGAYCCDGSAPGLSNTISLAWMDWVPSVTAKATATEYIIQWSGSEYGTGGGIHAQMILHAGSNDIEFQYTAHVNDGHDEFIGITDIAQADHLQYYAGGPNAFGALGLLISLTAVPEPASVLGTSLLLGSALSIRMRPRRKKIAA